MDHIIFKTDHKKHGADLPGNTDNIIIYGAGNFGKAVYKAITNLGFNVSGFLDAKAKPGDTYEGIPVNLPDSPVLTPEKRANVHVLIGIHNRDIEIYAVFKLLQKLGYKKILTPVALYDICGDLIGNRYWLTSKSYYDHRENEIKKCFSLWKDDTSKQLYRSILTYRITGNCKNSPSPTNGVQYLPAELPAWTRPLRFIDCGAYDGDTLSQFFKAGIPVQSVAAFEPDHDNFRKLCSFTGENKSLVGDITLWPCAVYCFTKQVKFASGIGESAGLSVNGNITVQCVAIDDVLPGFYPNLIKMDIEGAEYEALLGAKRVIEENKPGLAICVYHKPEDIWRIPLLINQWNYGYDFYLRLHAHNGFDLVMYAIKNN